MLIDHKIGTARRIFPDQRDDAYLPTDIWRSPMGSDERAKYSVSLSLQPILLPPVSDVLVLAKKHAQGKNGVMQSFRFIAPDEFEMFDVEEDSNVEAVLVNRKILKRMPAEKVLAVLRRYVFPYVSDGEAVKVDFSVTLSFDEISGDLEA